MQGSFDPFESTTTYVPELMYLIARSRTCSIAGEGYHKGTKPELPKYGYLYGCYKATVSCAFEGQDRPPRRPDDVLPSTRLPRVLSE